MKNWTINSITKAVVLNMLVAFNISASTVGLTTDTVYASSFEVGINIPSLFTVNHNTVFSQDLWQYTHLPEGTTIMGKTLTMYDETTQTWVSPPSWVWLEDPLNLEWVAEDMWTIPLRVEATTDNPSFPSISDEFALRVESWSGTVNQPPVLVVEASALNSAWNPVPLDETDPYNQWAHYTLSSFDTLVLDTTDSIDSDGEVVNLKLTSDVSWLIHDGELESVHIPRLGSWLENLTIEIIDNGGKKTTVTKRVARL